MVEWKKGNSHSLRCGATWALALVLALAQSFAAAHYHQKDFRDNFTQSVQGNDALCSLCLFHFHAPANPGAPASDTPRAVVVWRITLPSFVRLHAPAVTFLFSRAPPVLR